VEALVIKASTMRSRLAAVVAIGTAAATVLGSGPATAAPRPGRHVLSGSQPHWLGKARAIGNAPADSSNISFGLLLKLRDRAGAEATLASISDPDSADYGNWLTRNQFVARYAPAASDVSAVQTWLKSQGFTPTETLGGMYVEASGTTAQINKTFGTKMENYSYLGQTVHANSTALSLPDGTPSSVIGVLAGVTGLDQGSALKKPADTLPGPDTGFRIGTPCSKTRLPCLSMPTLVPPTPVT
jgi:hypothetical protein